MKDLGPTRDRVSKRLWLSQEHYIKKVLERFNMAKCKSVNTPLVCHFKLNSAQCPTSEEEQERMKQIPYASPVGCLMYAMVCTRLDIAHAVGVVSCFLSNPGKGH